MTIATNTVKVQELLLRNAISSSLRKLTNMNNLLCMYIVTMTGIMCGNDETSFINSAIDIIESIDKYNCLEIRICNSELYDNILQPMKPNKEFAYIKHTQDAIINEKYNEIIGKVKYTIKISGRSNSKLAPDKRVKMVVNEKGVEYVETWYDNVFIFESVNDVRIFHNYGKNILHDGKYHVIFKDNNENVSLVFDAANDIFIMGSAHIANMKNDTIFEYSNIALEVRELFLEKPHILFIGLYKKVDHVDAEGGGMERDRGNKGCIMSAMVSSVTDKFRLCMIEKYRSASIARETRSSSIHNMRKPKIKDGNGMELSFSIVGQYIIQVVTFQ